MVPVLVLEPASEFEFLLRFEPECKSGVAADNGVDVEDGGRDDGDGGGGRGGCAAAAAREVAGESGGVI